MPAEKKAAERRAPFASYHDRAFRPTGPKKTIHPTIEPFPKYIEDPPKELKRAPKTEDDDDKPNFKMTHNSKSIPCTSVATNFRNLKS